MNNKTGKRRSRLRLFLILTLLSACVALIAYMRFGNSNDQTAASGPLATAIESLELPKLSGFSFSKALAQLGAEAEPESLVVYSAMLPEQIAEYVIAFNSKYPNINIEYEAMGTVELAERVLAEKNNPQADVIWGLSATVMQQLAWNDVLKSYSPEGLENISPNFRDTNDPPVWVGQDIWMSAFCVNRDSLSSKNLQVPMSWQDLLDPEYEGLIAFPSPANSGTGYMAMLAYFEIFGTVNAWDALDKLDKNVSTYELGPSGACTAAAEGEVPIGVSYGLAGTKERKNNTSLVVVFPEEGSGWDMEAAGLIRQFPVKPDAHKLMDFIISPDAMHQYGLHYAITAIPVDYIPAPFGFPEDPVGQLMPKNFVWAGANRNRLLNEWEARYVDEDAPE